MAAAAPPAPAPARSARLAAARQALAEALEGAQEVAAPAAEASGAFRTHGTAGAPPGGEASRLEPAEVAGAAPGGGVTAAGLQRRALMWLAQRDHSEQELRDKLQRWAQAQVQVKVKLKAPGRGHPAGGQDESDLAPTPTPTPAQRDEARAQARAAAEVLHATLPAQLDALCDNLRAQGWLDDARFVAGRLRVRAPRQGMRRIEQELKRVGAQLDPDARAQLQATEAERAQAVWATRFTQAGATPADRARQGRFLVARGFAPEVVSRLLRRLPRAPAQAEADGWDDADTQNNIQSDTQTDPQDEG